MPRRGKGRSRRGGLMQGGHGAGAGAGGKSSDISTPQIVYVGPIPTGETFKDHITHISFPKAAADQRRKPHVLIRADARLTASDKAGMAAALIVSLDRMFDFGNMSTNPYKDINTHSATLGHRQSVFGYFPYALVTKSEDGKSKWRTETELVGLLSSDEEDDFQLKRIISTVVNKISPNALAFVRSMLEAIYRGQKVYLSTALPSEEGAYFLWHQILQHSIGEELSTEDARLLAEYVEFVGLPRTLQLNGSKGKKGYVTNWVTGSRTGTEKPELDHSKPFGASIKPKAFFSATKKHLDSLQPVVKKAHAARKSKEGAEREATEGQAMFDKLVAQAVPADTAVASPPSEADSSALTFSSRVADSILDDGINASRTFENPELDSEEKRYFSPPRGLMMTDFQHPEDLPPSRNLAPPTPSVTDSILNDSRSSEFSALGTSVHSPTPTERAAAANMDPYDPRGSGVGLSPQDPESFAAFDSHPLVARTPGPATSNAHFLALLEDNPPTDLATSRQSYAELKDPDAEEQEVSPEAATPIQSPASASPAPAATLASPAVPVLSPVSPPLTAQPASPQTPSDATDIEAEGQVASPEATTPLPSPASASPATSSAPAIIVSTATSPHSPTTASPHSPAERSDAEADERQAASPEATTPLPSPATASPAPSAAPVVSGATTPLTVAPAPMASASSASPMTPQDEEQIPSTEARTQQPKLSSTHSAEQGKNQIPKYLSYYAIIPTLTLASLTLLTHIGLMKISAVANASISSTMQFANPAYLGAGIALFLIGLVMLQKRFNANKPSGSGPREVHSTRSSSTLNPLSRSRTQTMSKNHKNSQTPRASNKLSHSSN